MTESNFGEAGSPPTAPWIEKTYQEEIPDDIRPFREILENYSHIPANEVDAHLHVIRDKAWAAARYPCVGMWSFTDLRCVEDPIFERAITRLKTPESGDALLDVGCGLGQVIRKLAADGVEPTKLYGSDLLPSYLDLGFELFKDRGRFANNFVAADLLQPDITALAGLEGKITLVHAGNFFHLFGWEKQVHIGSTLVQLLRPEAEGAMIFGRQIGRLHAGELISWKGDTRYWHDLGSLQKLWDEIGSKTGTSWKVDAKWLGKLPFQSDSLPEDIHYLSFTAYKL
ncbi:hypothetical protein B0T10DRAFT_563203 [Thelonectria olida]|uniref:Methyltransferase domain-containing protein n=1 Tax=Thelonectria olida TaxID=1576542 RepID=A0A9P8W1Z6_9HYPO|nr:hypothetical protein B0T10DRAFT_563203 [Thelonectria olida]